MERLEPVKLEQWFFSVIPSEVQPPAYVVACWGRELSPDASSSRLSRHILKERLSATEFVAQDGIQVELVGECDDTRAFDAGVPTTFINAFRAGIPPAYTMLIVLAPSIISLHDPPPVLVRPGESPPPSPTLKATAGQMIAYPDEKDPGIREPELELEAAGVLLDGVDAAPSVEVDAMSEKDCEDCRRLRANLGSEEEDEQPALLFATCARRGLEAAEQEAGHGEGGSDDGEVQTLLVADVEPRGRVEASAEALVLKEQFGDEVAVEERSLEGEGIVQETVIAKGSDGNSFNALDEEHEVASRCDTRDDTPSLLDPSPTPTPGAPTTAVLSKVDQAIEFYPTPTCDRSLPAELLTAPPLDDERHHRESQPAPDVQSMEGRGSQIKIAETLVATESRTHPPLSSILNSETDFPRPRRNSVITTISPTSSSPATPPTPQSTTHKPHLPSPPATSPFRPSHLAASLLITEPPRFSPSLFSQLDQDSDCEEDDESFTNQVLDFIKTDTEGLGSSSSPIRARGWFDRLPGPLPVMRSYSDPVIMDRGEERGSLLVDPMSRLAAATPSLPNSPRRQKTSGRPSPSPSLKSPARRPTSKILELSSPTPPPTSRILCRSSRTPSPPAAGLSEIRSETSSPRARLPIFPPSSSPSIFASTSQGDTILFAREPSSSPVQPPRWTSRRRSQPLVIPPSPEDTEMESTTTLAENEFEEEGDIEMETAFVSEKVKGKNVIANPTPSPSVRDECSSVVATRRITSTRRAINSTKTTGNAVASGSRLSATSSRPRLSKRASSSPTQVCFQPEPSPDLSHSRPRPRPRSQSRSRSLGIAPASTTTTTSNSMVESSVGRPVRSTRMRAAVARNWWELPIALESLEKQKRRRMGTGIGGGVKTEEAHEEGEERAVRDGAGEEGDSAEERGGSSGEESETIPAAKRPRVDPGRGGGSRGQRPPARGHRARSSRA